MAQPQYDFPGSPLERVAGLRDTIAAGGDQAQELRRLSETTVAALHEEGLYRFTLPPELGGEDATINETIEVLEAVAAIDASVAWNLMIGSEINAMVAGGMEGNLARKIFLEDADVICCGGGGPGTQPSYAEPQGDGSYKLWGRSTFMSGCNNATWAIMIAPIVENGQPQTDDNGAPVIRSWLLHKDQITIHDTWNMAGLRGSGSNDVEAVGGVIPEEHAEVQLMLPARYDNPVFRVPVPLRLSYNKAAVAIGVARGALDAFADLARTKVPVLATAALKNRATAQYRMGEAEGALRAARAFLFESMQAVHDELQRGIDTPSADTTMLGRLACTHAANVSLTVVDAIHNAAGTSALRLDHPLERKLRDAKGCATHRWVAHPLYAEIGKIFLDSDGINPEFLGESDARPS